MCNLCPRQCNIDRPITTGICNAGNDIKVASIVIHRGEEPPLSTGAGSGALFFSGCPLKCSFCQNKQISHFSYGHIITPDKLASYMVTLQAKGCSNINLVSPTHYTPQILEALYEANKSGLSIPIMINSSGYESLSCLKFWDRHAHIYLMDLKYGDNYTGKALSKVSDYWDMARKAIQYTWDTAGPLETDEHGCATRGLIVRHLVLPGMLSNPFSVLEFLAEISTDIPISIMSQYNPSFYEGTLSEMQRTVDADEYQVVLTKALELGFSTIYTQEIESVNTYTPDFLKDKPFGDYEKLF